MTPDTSQPRAIPTVAATTCDHLQFVPGCMCAGSGCGGHLRIAVAGRGTPDGDTQ